MDEIEFRRLSDVPPADLMALQNHPLVRRTLPLATDPMDEAGARGMIEGKERLWAEHGYGPWAFFVGGAFAGWGGLQPEGGDADLALVLHPRFWGLGRRIVPEVLRWAFEERRLPSVTISLPRDRRGAAGLARLGFAPEGGEVLNGVTFARYRLRAPT